MEFCFPELAQLLGRTLCREPSESRDHGPEAPGQAFLLGPSGPFLAVFSVLSCERSLPECTKRVSKLGWSPVFMIPQVVSVVPPLSGNWAFAGVLAFPPGQRPYGWTARVPRGGRVWEAARALAPLSLLLWQLYWVLQDAVLPFPP